MAIRVRDKASSALSLTYSLFPTADRASFDCALSVCAPFRAGTGLSAGCPRPLSLYECGLVSFDCAHGVRGKARNLFPHAFSLSRVRHGLLQTARIEGAHSDRAPSASTGGDPPVAHSCVHSPFLVGSSRAFSRAFRKHVRGQGVAPKRATCSVCTWQSNS